MDGFKYEELSEDKLTTFVIQCKLWWFLFVWVILNVVTWLAGVLGEIGQKHFHGRFNRLFKFRFSLISISLISDPS